MVTQNVFSRGIIQVARLELQHGRRLSTALSRTSAVQSQSVCATYLAMLWTSDETYFEHTLGGRSNIPSTACIQHFGRPSF
jgi:hypothetical protein